MFTSVILIHYAAVTFADRAQNVNNCAPAEESSQRSAIRAARGGGHSRQLNNHIGVIFIRPDVFHASRRNSKSRPAKLVWTRKYEMTGGHGHNNTRTSVSGISYWV